MGTSHLKSAQVTNLDATPPVRSTAGQNEIGVMRGVSGFVTAVAADAAGSTYRFCRVPSNAVVKQVLFESEAQGAGNVSLGVYRTAADGGAVVDADLFASRIDCASLVVQGDYTNESTQYNLNERNMPLWQAAGLTSDPGGFLDIAGTVDTTAVTTGTGKLGAVVYFTY
jgi:hypothetical protein